LTPQETLIEDIAVVFALPLPSDSLHDEQSAYYESELSSDLTCHKWEDDGVKLKKYLIA
jgi:hypothetical protein